MTDTVRPFPPSFQSNVVPLPSYATERSACFDFYCPYPVRLIPGEITQIPLGIYLEKGCKERYILQIKDRSSLARRGLEIKGGIIDIDYEGEIMLLMKNMTQFDEILQTGDRIAQGFWTETIMVPTIKSKTLIRGAGGFGSTGE